MYLALTNTGIYKSNNLENWKNIPIDISSINCGAFNGTLWVVGGESGTNYSCSLYYSFNGEVWYKVKYSNDMIYCVNDLYYDSEKFIAVGKSYNNKAIFENKESFSFGHNDIPEDFLQKSNLVAQNIYPD